MKKILTFTSSILIILSVGNFVFPMMAVLLIIWFGLFFITRKKKLDKQLTNSEYKLYIIIVIAYPILETIIKYLIVNYEVLYSCGWLNRIEHFSSAVGIGILIYPFIKSTLNKLNKLESFLFFICLVSCIGMGNEFLEYSIRFILNVHKRTYYYGDTIYDMGINILGAIAGYVILKLVNKTSLKK